MPGENRRRVSRVAELRRGLRPAIVVPALAIDQPEALSVRLHAPGAAVNLRAVASAPRVDQGTGALEQQRVARIVRRVAVRGVAHDARQRKREAHPKRPVSTCRIVTQSELRPDIVWPVRRIERNRERTGSARQIGRKGRAKPGDGSAA